MTSRHLGIDQILTPRQMGSYERFAMVRTGLSGMALMEMAGRQAAEVISRRYAGRADCLVVCGSGNNAGDGYVTARYLRSWGWRVICYSPLPRGELKGDAAVAANAWSACCGHREIDYPSLPAALDALSTTGVVVDALLGTGLEGPVRPHIAQLIESLNAHHGPVVSIDIPSGVCGATGRIAGVAVKADCTVTFQSSKRGHWLYPGADHRGSLEIVDIGIGGISDGPTGEGWAGGDIVMRRVQADVLRETLSKRRPNSHKGDFGHVLVVTGREGQFGAARLAADAALAVGAGTSTLGTTAARLGSLSSGLYEVMATALYEADLEPGWTERVKAYDALVVGPGLSDAPVVGRRLVESLPELRMPLVLDAQALNHLAVAPDGWPVLGPAVVTPHPGEAARLLGISAAEIQADRVGTVQRLIDLCGTHVVLKGAHTLIGLPCGDIYLCPDGNAGMATAGSGDVLAGVIGGMLAVGYEMDRAVVAGTVWHARAGDWFEAQYGAESLRARGLIDALREVERCCRS